MRTYFQYLFFLLSVAFVLSKPQNLYAQPQLSFSAAQSLTTGVSPAGLTIADLDGNSLPDIIIPNMIGNSISIFLATAKGQYGQATTISVPAKPMDVKVFDWTGDGKLDLIVSSHAAGVVSILQGSGNGVSFTQGSSIAVQSARNLALSDFDNNGSHELAVVSTSTTVNDTIYILKNVNGTLVIQSSLDAGIRTITSLAVGDLNGDGRPDLVGANGGLGSGVFIFSNSSTGTGFNPPVTKSLGMAPYGVRIAELTGDSFLDVIAANNNTGTATILTGNGNGLFNPVKSLKVGTNPTSISFGDFNKDGILDIAVSNQFSNDVSVLIGRGGGDYFDASSVGDTTGRLAVDSSDLNLDGYSDLATVNSANTASVWLNTTTALGGLQSDKASLPVGSFALIRATLSRPAPSGGVSLLISLDQAGLALVQSEAFIPEGQTNTTFTLAAKAKGNLKVKAELNGGVKELPIQIIDAPLCVSSISIVPNHASVAQNRTLQFQAFPLNSYGDPVDFPIAWTVSGGGMINNLSGLFTAGQQIGTFMVSANYKSISGTALVDVISDEAPLPPLNLRVIN